jgi:hypothetical protein
LLHRLILTVSTTASLCGAYALYSWVVTPIFTPAPAMPIVSSGASGDVANRPAESHDAATRFLPEYPWTAEAKYVWSGKHTVFAEELEMNDQTSEIELRPFAMIMRRGKEATNEPITVVCESARLTFAEEFDRSNPKLGRVIGAVLSGEVRVRGANGLAINTRNVVFQESSLRVWSDHPLTFASGQNRGSALGLEMELIPLRGTRDEDKPAVEGVRTVRLRRNVDMVLRRETRQASGPAQVENAHVTSAGSFEFNLETLVASFQDQVHVERLTEVGSPDHITCDLLRIVFEQAIAAVAGTAIQPVNQPPAPRVDAMAPDLGSLVFRRMWAEGKEVTLTAEQRQFSATMRGLTYDAQTRVVVLSDANGVKVFQGPNELRCPEIALVHAESGDIDKLVCRGAGWLESRQPNSGRLNFAAEWTKELRRTPDAESKLDLLEFEGNAKLRQPGRMILSGDLIKTWVTPGSEKSLASESTTKPNADPASQVRLERVLALKNVEFNSPQIAGTTERLEIAIEDGEVPVRPTSGVVIPKLSRDRLMVSTWPEQRVVKRTAKPSRPLPSRLNSQIQTLPRVDSSTYSMRNAGQSAVSNQQSGLMQVPPDPARLPIKSAGKRTSLPMDSRSSAASVARVRAVTKDAGDSTRENRTVANEVAAKPSRRPLEVAADVIRVRVVRGPDSRGEDQYDVAEVWNEGHVYVQQTREDGSPPLQSRGDKLHLQNISETEQIVRIDGNPATIEDRGLRIEGKQVHLDRGKNLAWVEGAGRLRILVSKSLDGQPAPQPLNVTWQEKMTFDGDVAKFFSNVVATQKDDRTRSEMKCQEMHAFFSRRVSFTEEQSDAGEPEIQRIVCLENVDVKNEEIEGTKLMSVRRGHVWEFTLEPVTGVTTAHGPGYLTVWSHGRGNSAGLSPTATVRANQSLSSDNADWEYIRIDFAGQMAGNSRDQFTTFRDRVRIVSGPVNRPNDVVDGDALPRHGGKMQCNVLEVTQTPPTSTQPGFIQLRGSGNARLEGRSDRTGSAVFSALADNISFDQSKGLYTLWSQGRNKATIWRESQLGGSRSGAPAQRIEFNPVLNELRVDKGTGLFGVE